MTRWIVRLQHSECNAWEQGLLDAQALELGVGGWLVPILVEQDGSLAWQPEVSRSRQHPYALELHIKATLSPGQEQRLIGQLLPHLSITNTLLLKTRPVLLVQGLRTLASLRFSLRRWRQRCPKLLLLGKSGERDLLAPADAAELDGWVDGITAEANYLRYLKRAHHRLGWGGLEIPAVRALTAEEDQHCLNGSVGRYREWMAQACAWSTVMLGSACDALVVIDNWRGHQRWGHQQAANNHAAGQELRVPLASLRDGVITRGWGQANKNHVALLIHAFYPSKLEEMLQQLASQQNVNGSTIDLYVSTPREQIDLVAQILSQQEWPTVMLFGVENCGRDLVPFLLHLLPAAQHHGHRLFIKAHTKFSPHLEETTRQAWSHHLVASLLTTRMVEVIQQQLEKQPAVGLLAPAGCLMPMSMALFQNCCHLMDLLQQSSLQGAWALEQRFIAGSMFAGRLQALDSINLAMIQDLWNEAEQGQTDGTMSHALERWLTLIVLQAGWNVIELNTGDCSNIPNFGYQKVQ